MKIALLSADDSHTLRTGGKHVHQNLLEKGLKKLGNDVATFYYPHEKFSKRLLRIGLKHPFKAFSYLFSKSKRFKAVVEDMMDFFKRLDLRRFDVVHAHDVVSLANVHHESSVLTVHGYFARESVDYLMGISESEKREIYEFGLEIERKAVSNPNLKKIISVDTRIARYLIDELKVDEKKITVIYNAIDTDLFHPVSEGEKLRIRESLGLPKDRFIVLVPRRYVKKNGVVYAAQAFSKMRDPEYFFVFIGRGPLKSQIKEILKHNDNALVLDGIPHDEIVKYYQASDVVLVPSVTSEGVEEATSLSMLEGMACGKVVICTDVGGMKEVVENGKNGFLIPQRDPDAILEAIEHVKKHWNDLENLRKRAREYVVKNHGYLEYAKRVVKIYEEIISS